VTRLTARPLQIAKTLGAIESLRGVHSAEGFEIDATKAGGARLLHDLPQEQTTEASAPHFGQKVHLAEFADALIGSRSFERGIAGAPSNPAGAIHDDTETPVLALVGRRHRIHLGIDDGEALTAGSEFGHDPTNDVGKCRIIVLSQRANLKTGGRRLHGGSFAEERSSDKSRLDGREGRVHSSQDGGTTRDRAAEEKAGMAKFMETIEQLWPILAFVGGVFGFLLAFDWFVLRRRDASQARDPGSYRRPLLILGAAFATLLILLFALDIGEGQRNAILSLVGLAVTGVIAVSSTTFVSNAMAGLLLRSVRSYRPGDFIKVDRHFGRVTEIGLFHTEIQTEDRDLTTLPNLYLLSNPIRVIRRSGTVVSAEVSLGYDASHQKVEPVLLSAIEAAGLEEGFVQVTNLGDFAINYRTAGLLRDPKTLLTVRSNLRKAMIDALHAANIEIVSPRFMNQRVLDPTESVIPTQIHRSAPPEIASAAVESKVFDKAEAAAAIEKLRGERDALGEEIAGLEAEHKAEKDEAARERLGARLEQRKSWLAAIESGLASRQARLADDAD
jgi:small conductance mechanosensitive channel